MEKRIPQQGEGNHIISAVMDDEQVVTTLERVEASYGNGYMVIDVPMAGESEGERFIRAFSYTPEIAGDAYYRITGRHVPRAAILG